MKVLYIQHAGDVGGSSMSLLYTIEGMREIGHTCVVALARPSTQLMRLYMNAGFETIPWPGLALWDHSAGAPRPLRDPRTWAMYANIATGWRRTSYRLLELVDSIRPDIIHLNSMVFSIVADALIRERTPFVWHVREPPPDQGVRTQLIRRLMMRAPQLIFISEYDRQQWIGTEKGHVIHNFVELERFHPSIDGQMVRQEHLIPPTAIVVLYVGGVSEVKGFFVLLDALHLLKERNVPFVCLMPGTTLGESLSWQGKAASKVLPLFGSGTPKQLANRRIAEYGLTEFLRPLPFAPDIAPFFAASDVVVFPSTKPHFARPIIESIAMQKPAVGSDLGGVRELLDIHPLGRVVPPGNASALADAIVEAVKGSRFSMDLQSRFDETKRLFDRRHGVEAINSVYLEVLNRHYA